MKFKNFCLIGFAVVAIMFSTTCAQVGPTDPDITPKEKQISVQYIRQPPIGYQWPDVVILRWSYTNYQGAVGMTRTSEDNFSCGALIKTETKISMVVDDVRKEDPYVRKRLFVDGRELIFDGSVEGSVEFIYHNDGKIEITSPK